MAWTIYTKDGDERVVSWSVGEVMGDHSVATASNKTTSVRHHIHPDLEYSGEWMGECFVTLTIRSAVPVDFEIGDYVIYRNEKFVMNYDPTVVKKARRGTYGEGFTYDNVKFNALSYELTDVRMLDYVLNDNEVHYSSLPNFSTFCATIDDLADRLQVNTDRYCEANNITGLDRWIFVTHTYTTDRYGNHVPSRTRQRQLGKLTNAEMQELTSTWHTYYDSGSATDDEKIDQNVNVSNMSVWETMKYIKETFGLHFIIRGRMVIIGAPGVLTSKIFKYGKDNGLYEIERTADSEQQVITKLYSYGSDKNLPLRYYANLNKDCYAIVRKATDVPSGIDYTLIGIPFGPPCFTTRVILHGVVTAAVQFTYNGSTYSAYVRDSSIIPNIATPNESILFGEGLPNFVGSEQIFFTSGINKDVWPSDQTTYDATLPPNMAIDKLMLPGFPEESLYDWVVGSIWGQAIRDEHNSNAIGKASWKGHVAYFSKDKYQPYILSSNFYILGIREATKFFDGSDGDEEIYPTIKNAPNNVDTIYEADTIEDNGMFGEGEEIPTFHVTLPDFGEDFNLQALRTDETQIEVTSGYCGGRAFGIVAATKNDNGTWDCECNRDLDSDIQIYFPYAYDTVGANLPYQLRRDDKYVLTGIEMTSTYIEWGAEKLLEAALTYLDKNCEVRYTYIPRIDEIFMARERDNAVAGQSLYDLLKEGDLFHFTDTDLGKKEVVNNEDIRDLDAMIYIDNLRIKEYGNGQIPTFEITLRNDKQVGSIQRMQEQLSTLTNVVVSGGASGVGGGGGVNVAQTKTLIESYGKDLFLSKKDADTAAGTITFNNGIALGSKALTNIIRTSDALTNSDAAVLSELRALQTFLRKDQDELMPNLLRFRVGIESEHYQTGDQGVGQGFALKQDGAGHFYLEIDDVNVRRKLTVSVLDVKRTMFSQGPQVLTNANGTIKGVVPLDANGQSLGIYVFGITDGEDFYTLMTGVNKTREQVLADLASADSYKLYFLASDGEKTLYDFWRTGDLALCRELNVVEQPDTEQYTDNDENSDTYEQQMANHHWHRLVTDHGTESVGSSSSSSSGDEGRMYHYIVVSNRKNDSDLPVRDVFEIVNDTDRDLYGRNSYIAWSYDGTLQNTIPAIDDDVVQYGSVLDPERQEATTMSPNSKGGILSHVKDIGSVVEAASDPTDATEVKAKSGQQFTSNNENLHLGDTVKIVADSFLITTQRGTQTVSYPVPVQMPDEWTSGTTALYYQQWTYQGQQWLCINPEGTSTTPSIETPPTNWKLLVAKGADGSAVRRWVEYGPSEIHVDGNGVVQNDTNIYVRFYEQTGDGNPVSKTSSVADEDVQIGINAVIFRDSSRYEIDDNIFADDEEITEISNFYHSSGSSKYFTFKAGDILENLQIRGTDANGKTYSWSYLTISLDGVDGKDAWVIDTNPAFVTIEERLLKNKDVPTPTSDNPEDYYMPVDQQGIPRLQKTTIVPTYVEVRLSIAGQRVAPTNIGFWEDAYGNRGCTSNLSVNVYSGSTDKFTVALSGASGTERTTNGGVYLIVYYTQDGVSQSQRVTIPVYINRTGTYVSETIGDVTTDLRTRTSKIVDTNGQPVDLVLQSTFTSSAAGWNSSISRLENFVSENGAMSTAKWTGEINASATALTTQYKEYVNGYAVSQSTFEQTADSIKLGVERVAMGNILEETDWRGRTIKYIFSQEVEEKSYSSGTYYHPFDKIAKSSKDYVLVGAASARGSSAPGDPWVNILPDNTNTDLTKWTAQNAVWPIENAFNKMTAFHVLKPILDSQQTIKTFDTSCIKQTVGNKLSASTVYTLSFYYRSSSVMHLNINAIFDTSATLTDGTNTGAAIINGHYVVYDTQQADPETGVFLQANPVFPSTNWEWTYISFTFKTKSSISSTATLGFDAYSSSIYVERKFEVVIPKLEVGDVATPWNDLPDALKKSGIDIYAEKIVATTDNFEVHNAEGDTTFSIDADGNIQGSGDAKFAGTVDAKVLYMTSAIVYIDRTDATNGYVKSENESGVDGLVKRCGGRLPQRLIIRFDANMTGYSNQNQTVSVRIPPASQYQGLEMDIFFPGKYTYTSGWYMPAIGIYTGNPTDEQGDIISGSADGSFRDVFNDQTTVYGVTTRDNIYVNYKTVCKVRLLSLPEDDGGGNIVWRWMVLETVNCDMDVQN